MKPSDMKRPPRILIYGKNKQGKTRFCTSAPDVLVLDPEGGTEAETEINPDTWPIDRWEDLNEVYMFLRAGKHPYKWVAIDGLTKMYGMALRWVMNQEEERNLERKPGQVGKQDYGKANEMMKGVLANFDSLRTIGLILTAQQRMEQVDSGEEDEDAGDSGTVFVPDIPKGLRSTVNSLVSVIGRAYIVRGVIKKKVRKGEKVVMKEVDGIHYRIWIGSHPSYDTGTRSEHKLPDHITDPTVPKLLRLMKEGK